MDNEVPTFRITLPKNEFISLKRISNGYLSELFPELAINENGYLNLNENDFMISSEDYKNIEQINFEELEILFKILNENKNINLIKVFHVLSQYRQG
ncbi:hypothetical protein H8356DRAFT_1345138 [Neocallimastix lanati (nom. inval.)]|nr:hypothetical protein H8356DRAFT_1345138 [Neocallimastix sp. JGI-2020a]